MIYLSIPNTGEINQGILQATHMSSQKHEVELAPRACGCLAHNFNMGWCGGLNLRQPKGIDRFAMLHSDIVPDPWWLDLLEDERAYHGADVMCAISPIKDDSGYTSCGQGNLETWDVKRYTMTEIYQLPETFGIEKRLAKTHYLAANVGAFICKWDGEWEVDFARRGGFRVLTTCILCADAQWRATFYPDDWDFSRWCHMRGLKVMCTRKLGLDHFGLQRYSNRFPWGLEEDTETPMGIRF